MSDKHKTVKDINQDKPQSDTFNLNMLKQLFKRSADIKFQDYTFNHYQVTFITCDQMVDELLLNDMIIERIKLFLNSVRKRAFKESVKKNLHIPELNEVVEKNDLITKVYSGYVLIYFEDFNCIYSSNIIDKPNRQPEETKTEVTIKGPRDNFIEDIATNIALIRKRLPTNSLCVETLNIGKRTKTTIALLYFDDITNIDILNEIKDKLNKIDTDIIISGDTLMEYIENKSILIPQHDYTGRPDFAVQALVRGRICILIDGVAYSIITPINLFMLFKSGEDSEYPTTYSSFGRLLRLSALFIGTFLPSLWLALTSFHQNQLPLLLLATVVQASTGLPFPTALELLLMLLIFELFREAGLRLPEAIGGIFSVVGGLIIGDAAIRAGITSPAMVVIIAISIIATYTLLNQSLVAAVSLIRFISILLTAFFGLFGLLMSFYFTLTYIANIRTFSVPYLNLAEKLSWASIKKTFLRIPQKEYVSRPQALKTIDNTRTKED